MDFSAPLIHGTFLKRYKRFFVDAQLPDGTTVTAHCPNTGSMLGLMGNDYGVYLSPADNPERKLRYTLEMIDVGTSLVGVNTSRPNAIVADAVATGLIPELTGYATLEREKKYGKNSRIDILLNDPAKGTCFIEVKNTTLREGNAALFPDAVTSRGLKHLEELMAERKAGNRVVMFYLVQRSDCDYFSVADTIDPAYGKTLRQAVAEGLEIMAYSCKLNATAITVDKKLEVRL
ncbi:MAG: DNA/RNA nuclease SfsA [Proteobacteria bacterium]|nr:DNA/RNA nuclease SfsA [Pseudomonadota bacterium]